MTINSCVQAWPTDTIPFFKNADSVTSSSALDSSSGLVQPSLVDMSDVKSSKDANTVLDYGVIIYSYSFTVIVLLILVQVFSVEVKDSIAK